MSLEFATLLLEIQCVAFICLGLFVQRRACILKFEIVSVQEQFDMRSKMAHDYCRQEEGQKEREKEQQQNARMMTARKGLLQGALYIVNASVNRTVVCGCGQQQSLGCLCRHLKRFAQLLFYSISIMAGNSQFCCVVSSILAVSSQRFAVQNNHC